MYKTQEHLPLNISQRIVFSPFSPLTINQQITFSLYVYVRHTLHSSNTWPSGKASASRAEDPAFESLLSREFSASSHTSDFKIGSPVATLPGAWRYRVSAGTGRPGVSILWVGEVERLICNFCLSVAARKIVWEDPSGPWKTLACCWDVKQPTNKQTNPVSVYVHVGLTLHSSNTSNQKRRQQTTKLNATSVYFSEAFQSQHKVLVISYSTGLLNNWGQINISIHWFS